jgi:hypothetical protein
MSLSALNSSNVPLGSQRIFIGKYEQVTPYATALISVLADQTCELICFQSADQLHSTSVTYSVPPGLAPIAVQLASPYFRLTLRNTSVTALTYLNLTTIYRTSQVDISLSNSVEISNWLPFSFDTQSKLKCIDASANAQLSTLNSTTLDISVGLSRLINTRQSVLIFNGTYYDGSLSAPVHLGAKASQNCLSVYGNTSLDGSFVVVYSPDSVHKYDTQYAYVAAAGDFGFNLPATGASYMYLRAHGAAAMDISAYVETC